MNRSILIAEDSATQAEQLRMLLEEAGYSVAVARSGEEALERIVAAGFDLVLSDIMMPGMSGYELCRRVKQRSDVPVVLLTSLNDPTDIVRGLEAGADNYITKPYDPEHLLTRIDRVLDGRQLRRSGRTTMGVDIVFLGSRFTITSDKEQILDLLLSSVEDIVRANHTLAAQQRQLAEAHQRLEGFARAKAQEAQSSTERYRALMQKAGDAILVLDARAVVLEANARAADLFGRPLGELHGQEVRQLLASAEDGEALHQSVTRLVDGAELAHVEYRFTRADGRVVYCEISASTASPQGTDLVLVIVRDVTERTLAEQQLRRSERQLAEAQRLAQVGSWEWDFETDVLTGSDEVMRIFEFSPDDVGSSWLGPMTERIVPDDLDRVLDTMQLARREGTTVEIQYRIRTMQGTAKTLVARSEVTRVASSGKPRAMFGTLQDVTARVEAAEALRLSEEQLRQAQRMEAIGRLTGGIAHDFNNMLTAIQCGTQMLLEDAAEGSDIREELEQIDLAATRAAALTRQLLAFSRKQVLQSAPVDLNDVVTETHGMLRRLMGEDVELRTALDPALGRTMTDGGQMQQVLINLVVNARDAMADGGMVTITTRNVEPGEVAGMERDVAPGAYVLLAVGDTGTGMSAEVAEHIFEPFFTTKGLGKGTGLGLSTVYGIVTQMGGSIWVETGPGRGSTFTVLLPRTEQHAEGAAAPRPATALAGTETILLVEDEAMVRRLARRNLQSQGYTVLEAGDGVEALALAARHAGTIDLLLTDVVMPGISGRELAEQLRQERPSLQVVYMSGYIDDAIAHHGVLEPGIALVEKPFTAEGLAAMIRAVLERRPADC
jgi:two-component system cell cycle sensor histidine kinase/response regulator CckA